MIDRLAISRSEVICEGWAFPPMPLVTSESPAFTLNGVPPASARVEGWRPEVSSVFWQREEALRSGFSCRWDVTDVNPFRDGFLDLNYENSPSHLPRGLRRSWHLADPEKEPALPSEEQRFRVIATKDPFAFRLGGATDFRRLNAAIEAFTGRDLKQCGAVLDWGVGCGRVARYAAMTVGGKFTGCDVDRDNVGWCQANLPGTFLQSQMRPPLPFESASFDLIYGVSVFTHLREELQDQWLAELRRVLRPGGLLVMTVHGHTTIDYAPLTPSDHIALLKRVAHAGILVEGSNDGLVGAVDDAHEYKNVFHHKAYIQRHWSHWLDVVAIIPGYIFTHDLVILRRRP
jgi:SAM-dependent methyltransferase